MGSRPYTRRLIVAVVVVAALLAVVVLVPDRPRPSVNVPPGSVFGSKSAPYEYYDPDSLSWRDFVYVGRPVYQSRLYLMTVWAPGEHGCYVLSPADEWAAVPDLRDQVVDLMSRFEKRSYSYDPDTLANLPTFSATCAPGQDALQIRLDDLAETYLGLTGMYGMEVTIARGEDPSVYGIHWCPSSGHEDGTCYQVGAVLMHELGHVLGLAHSAPGVGPGPSLTIMSVESSDWDSETSAQFGACDMAGLQARYGLAGPDSKLSACLPPMGTKVTLSRDGGRLAAQVRIDPATISSSLTEVLWFSGDPPVPEVGHWDTHGFDDQLVHSDAAVELWQRDTSGGSVQDRRVGVMSYSASPEPEWTIDLPESASGATYFARFVGDGSLLADDSDPLSV